MQARFLLPRLAAVLLAVAAMPFVAQAATVTVVNRSPDTIRQIFIAPAGSGNSGENRLRSQLPPNAEARITYSTGCTVDVRLGFDGGRTEQFLAQDACADLRVTAGQGAAASAAPLPARSPVSDTPRSAAATPTAAQARNTAAKPPVLAPVVVPPWTGRSITRRFGGME